MKSLTVFLRAALAQLSALLNALIRVVQVQRRAQLIVVLLVSAIVGFLVAYTVHSTRSLKHQWASHKSVLVIAHDIAAGDSLNSSNTLLVDLPLAIQPINALTVLPLQARTRIALSTRTTLTDSMIVVDGFRIQIPQGWRGVAMSTDLVAPTLVVGDHVDVVSFDTVIAGAALVIEVSPTQGITIAVPAATAAVVATASRTGDISLVLAT